MFGALGPGERRGVLTVLLEVSNQKLLQFLFGTVHALRQCLPGENAEKAFDHVHPGSVRGGIVKVHSGMTQEPLFGGFVLMDVEVCRARREGRLRGRTSRRRPLNSKSPPWSAGLAHGRLPYRWQSPGR